MKGEFSFRPQAEVRFNGQRYRLIERREDGEGGKRIWWLRSHGDGSIRPFPEKELLQSYVEGTLEAHVDFGDGTLLQRQEKARRRATSFEDLTDTEKARVKLKKEFLKRVRTASLGSGMWVKLGEIESEAKTPLEAIVLKVGEELEHKISVSTLLRWQKQEEQGQRELVGSFALRGWRDRLGTVVRERVMKAFNDLIESASDKHEVGAPLVITIVELRAAAEAAVDIARLTHPGEVLKVPRSTTLYKWWNQIPAYERDVAKYGRSKANRMHRSVKGHDRPEAAMDVVEYDETGMPFFFYDEKNGGPLGKAWLGWLIDVYSRSVVGFFIGFEPVSDLMMNSAVRHACLPKTYVEELYGGTITNDYGQFGKFRVLRVDNSKPAWGKTAEEIAAQLEGDWDFCPVRQPYFKPVVEAMFLRLEQALLRHVPGFVLPGFDRSDYDPEKMATIGFDAFLHIFHNRLIDDYHTRPQKGLGCSPNEKWAEGCRDVAPGLLDRAQDIRTMFGLVREGTLDHRGVVFKHIRYNSPALLNIRLRKGHKIKVRVKVDPGDLGRVHVWDDRHKGWVEAVAVEDARAAGLSLHRHELVLKWSRERYGRQDHQTWMTARAELNEIISRWAANPDTAKGMTLFARAAGLGTHNIFDSRGHDGRIAELRGPFRPLPGAATAPPPALAAPAPTAARAVAAPGEGASGDEVVPGSPGRAVAAVPPPADAGTMPDSPRRRSRIVLEADYSLASASPRPASRPS